MNKLLEVIKMCKFPVSEFNLKKIKTVFSTSLPAITNWNIIFKMVQFHNSNKNYEVYGNKSRIHKISMVVKKK